MSPNATRSRAAGSGTACDDPSQPAHAVRVVICAESRDGITKHYSRRRHLTQRAVVRTAARPVAEFLAGLCAVLHHEEFRVASARY